MGEISVYLPGIILAYTTFFVAIASPGPNILAVLGTSMSVGRKSGIALALGVAAGSFCWAMLSVVGLSALLASYASALRVIKIAGGCYLLWLAYKSFRSAASKHDIEARTLGGSTRSPIGHAIRGLTIQMTNPKAALAWIAIMSLGLQAGAPLWVPVSLVAGTSILSVIIHCVYAVAFSTPVMVRFYAKARRSIQATLGALFAFAGLKLLTSRS
jgi:amino acid exporter